MKFRATLIAAFYLLLATLAGAQNTSTYGNVTAGAATCTPTSCIYYQLPANTPWVVVSVTGTWSGTLQIQAITSQSADYSYASLNSAPWTLAATMTSNGSLSVATAGATFILVQAPTWASGKATVTMTASDTGAPLSNPVFGGGMTSVGVKAPNGGSSANCWLTNGTSAPCGTWAAVLAGGHPYIDVSYPTLGADCTGTADSSNALAAADALGISALVPATCNLRVSSSKTLTSAWTINQGGMISPDAGVTLTFAQPPNAGRYQIYSGSGTVAFSSVPTVFPEWWGAQPSHTYNTSTCSVHDDTAAMLAAKASLPLTSSSIPLYFGGYAQQGIISLQAPYRYCMNSAYIVSYGTTITGGEAPGTAYIDFPTSANIPQVAGSEPFALAFNPPGSSNSGISLNTAYASLCRGIGVNITTSSTNFASGIFFPGAQNARLEGCSANGGYWRGIVALSAPVTKSSGIITAGGTQQGPDLDLFGQAQYDIVDASPSTSTGNPGTGVWGQMDVLVPASYTSTIPAVSSCSNIRVLVLSGNGTGYSGGYSQFPMRYMAVTTGTPAQGQYSVSGCTLTFNSAEWNDRLRIYYQDGAAIQTTNLAFSTTAPKYTFAPVPSVQIELLSDIHIGQIFMEGGYTSLRTFRTQGLLVDYIESHPSTAVGTSSTSQAAIVLDPDSANVILPIQNYYITGAGSVQKWAYGVWDMANSNTTSGHRALTANSVLGNFATDHYSQQLLNQNQLPVAGSTASSRGAGYCDGTTVICAADGQMSTAAGAKLNWWVINNGVRTSSGATFFVTNATRISSFDLPSPVSFSKIYVVVSAADATANLYNLAILDSTQTAVANCTTGPTAGTTFLPAIGSAEIALTGTCVLPQGHYYVVTTTNAATPGQIYGVQSYNALQNGTPSTGNTTSGAVFASSIILGEVWNSANPTPLVGLSN